VGVEEAISNAIQDLDIHEATAFVHDVLRSRARFTSDQFFVLLELEEWGPLSSQLLEEMGYNRSYVRHVLQRLKKKRLIEHCGFHFHQSIKNNAIYPVKLYRLKDAPERECIV